MLPRNEELQSRVQPENIALRFRVEGEILELKVSLGQAIEIGNEAKSLLEEKVCCLQCDYMEIGRITQRVASWLASRRAFIQFQNVSCRGVFFSVVEFRQIWQ